MILRTLILIFVILTWSQIREMNSKLINYKELYEKTGIQIGCSFRAR